MTDRLKEDIRNCEMLLIGIGSEWERADEAGARGKSEDITGVYDGICNFVRDKDYFIVASCSDGSIYESILNPERIAAPFFDSDNGEGQWKRYNRWLQSTLNKYIAIIELGEGFERPEFMRWPFENITFINNKAKFYRIHAKLPNIPENIRDKSMAVKENSLEFMIKMLENNN